MNKKRDFDLVLKVRGAMFELKEQLTCLVLICAHFNFTKFGNFQACAKGYVAF